MIISKQVYQRAEKHWLEYVKGELRLGGLLMICGIIGMAIHIAL